MSLITNFGLFGKKGKTRWSTAYPKHSWQPGFRRVWNEFI
jgi:hypothetical protein